MKLVVVTKRWEDRYKLGCGNMVVGTGLWEHGRVESFFHTFRLKSLSEPLAWH